MTLWIEAHQAPLSRDSPGKSTGMGCHALLRGIFTTQGLNLVCIAGRFFTVWATREVRGLVAKNPEIEMRKGEQALFPTACILSSAITGLLPGWLDLGWPLTQKRSASGSRALQTVCTSSRSRTCMVNPWRKKLIFEVTFFSQKWQCVFKD